MLGLSVQPKFKGVNPRGALSGAQLRNDAKA